MNMHEISYDASEALRYYADNYHDDERYDCNDPFEIVAAHEEELGEPIYFAARA